MNPAPLLMPLPESLDDIPHLPRSKYSTLVAWVLVAVTLCALAAAAFLVVSFRPAPYFVPNTLVHIDSDMSLAATGELLKKDHVIASTFVFRSVIFLLGGSRSVTAGDYFFQTAPSIWNVAYRLIHNEQGLTPVRVTFPEGTSVRGMGVILGEDLDSGAATDGQTSSSPVFSFSTSTFALLASTSEGYLFPDTYFFAPNVTPATVIATMKDNFNQKIWSLSALIKASGRSTHDIVIMASILEKEALTDSDRRMVASILWKRIDAGQPLQVDPPFAYALGKTSDELTDADLRTDSPYNTYINKGLPPTPINNPGLEALTAAASAATSSPASTTPYWYYLSDKNGVMHYAVTYAQHLANRAEYLGK